MGNWHESQQTDWELLRAYVDDVERLVEISIDNYHKEKVEHVYGETDYGQPLVVEYHNGLDDQTWDLHGVFTEHFPNMQRKAALLVLYGYFEKKIEEYCKLCKEERAIKIALRDISGKGVERAATYLAKAVELDNAKKSGKWGEIQCINKVRNYIVHNYGRIPVTNKSREAVLRYLESNEYLMWNNEIIINKGYLSHVLSVFIKYFHDLTMSARRAQ